MKKKMKFNTKAIHGGQILDPAYGSVMTPIYQTSTYAQTSPGKHKGYEYSRTHNPTRTNFERSIASLENLSPIIRNTSSIENPNFRKLTVIKRLKTVHSLELD